MQYCVYLITYSGNKLPPFYIGSTSIKQIQNNYLGSVSSKKYRDIWKVETKNNRTLFKIRIIKKFNTRQEALNYEYSLHIKLDVVKNSLYVNMSRANKNGMFGMDVKGELNPNYGKKWNLESKHNLSKNHKSDAIKNPRIWATLYIFDKPISKHIYVRDMELYLNQGWIISKRAMKVKNIEKSGKDRMAKLNSMRCCCLICKIEIQPHALERHFNSKHIPKIEFKGEWFSTFDELKIKTGVSEYLYYSWYKNGYDPLSKLSLKV